MAPADRGKELYRKAQRYIPGGVNSPVRSFSAVGGYPVFIKRGAGPCMYGETGGRFIDYCCSWGALILGHAHPAVVRALERVIKQGTSFGAATKREVTLAQAIVEAVPSIEQVRLTSSGTEAVMGAVRLARAFTGRNKIIKFDGSYHGHADYLLVKGGSGIATLGIPGSPGVPRDFTKHTLVAGYNDAAAVRKLAAKHGKDLAAIIVEPVAANCGVVPPRPGFLQALRKVADRSGSVLIFDEVITGFRLALGGAQRVFRVKPDLTCLGKIIGGGLPIGAFGGRRDIMQLLAPVGDVYQAGTLSGNPVAVAAGLATLGLLKKREPYRALEARTRTLCEGIDDLAAKHGIDVRINRAGSLFTVFFSDREVVDYATARLQDTKRFAKFHRGLLEGGVYFSPSGFEANFLSTAHTAGDVGKTLKTAGRVLRGMGGR